MTERRSSTRAPEAAERDQLRYRVKASEVADVLGVGRSTVSNWRTRYKDVFPTPVVGGSSPQFDVDDVLDWADSPNSPVEARKPPTAAWWWGKAVEAFHAQYISHPTREFLTSLVLLNAVLAHGVGEVEPDPDRWLRLLAASNPVKAVSREARRTERANRHLAGLLTEPLDSVPVAPAVLGEMVRRLDDASVESDPSVVLDEVLRRTEDLSVGSPQADTPAEIARLMVLIADVRPGRTVFDPATGEGTTLLAADREASARGGSAGLFGQELDPAIWRIATTRFLIAGASVNLADAGHDSVDDDQWQALQADAVVLDPPVGTGAPSLLRWVDHATNHVAEAGRVVIALPAHALVEVSSARRATDRHLVARIAGLLDEGYVEGVVVTPRRARSDVTGPLTLWVLRADPVLDRAVLVVTPLDARLRVRMTSPEDLPIETDDIAEVFNHWRQYGEPTAADVRPGIHVLEVPGRDVITSLHEAVQGVLPKSTQDVEVVSTGERRRDDDRERGRRVQLQAHVERLIDLIEPHLEALWEGDRMGYMAVRDEINALRRIR